MNKYKLLFIQILVVNTIHAQLINDDKNWNSVPVFSDNFNQPRSAWDSHWIDNPLDNKWYCNLLYMRTHGNNEHQLYSKPNSVFSSDSTIHLIAEYAGGLIPSTYEIPWRGYLDTSVHELYYYSGAITAKDTFRYGYFETRCRLPVIRGAFPAFWLYNQNADYYGEIDVFEYTASFWGSPEDSARVFQGGFYSGNPVTRQHYVFPMYHVSSTVPDLSQYHKYGLEWSPNRLILYFDDEMIGESHLDTIPRNFMYLMINYALDNLTLHYGVPDTTYFPNEMVIDYVRIYKLRSLHCGLSDTIKNQTQFTNFTYEVKKNIYVAGFGSSVILPSNSKTFFRATDEITLGASFEVPLGSELNLITHPCPQ